MVAGEGKRSISGIRALFHLLSLDRFADAQRHDPSRGPGVVWPSYQALRDADVHSGDPLNVLVASRLISLLYGPDFTESVPVMTWLALSVPPMYMNIMVNQILIARRQQMLWTKAMAVACVINPVLNVLLIPYCQRTRGNGAIGAAISLLLTELVLVGIGVVVIRSCFNREFLDRLARATL